MTQVQSVPAAAVPRREQYEVAPREPVAWHAYAVLFSPARILEGLERVGEAGLVERLPNLWQIELGVLRMWHRVLFRPDSIGTSRSNPVRPGWRARLLHYRLLRFPFLVRERAIAPFDFSGLVSSPSRIVTHLLGAHHDENQFVYDLELLSAYPGRLEQVCGLARHVVEADIPRSRWLRDLVVYERYHENLVAAVERALEGDFSLPPDEADNPDISFVAYLRWCASQPATPAETWMLWRAGRYSVPDGVQGAA
jgi:hypothetical protein